MQPRPALHSQQFFGDGRSSSLTSRGWTHGGPRVKISSVKPWVYAGGVLVVLLLQGCGKEEGSAEPVGDIRGAPIVASPTSAANTNVAAARPAVAPTNAVTVAPAPAAGGYVAVGFEELSGYQIEISDELLGPQTNRTVLTADGQIPEPIKELNNRKISLRGFMLPLKVEGGLVTEMLIMKDQSMCCYGATPRINEWVSVKMKNGVKPLMDEPVTLMGTLKVGETRENGYLVGIYAMDGDKMAERN